MAKNQAYQEYEEKLYAVTDASLLCKDNVKALFSELFSVLPNGGKLYKYKSLDSFHIDELEEKYVWFSSAKHLNDNKDCTFNANVLQEMEKLIRFFLKDNNFRKTLVNGFYLELVQHNPNITPEVVEDCFNCITKNGRKIGKLKFDSFCQKYKLTHVQKQKLLNTVALYGDEYQCEEQIRKRISNFVAQTEEVRDSMQILSLTTSYKKDSMWAYYCNNEGICIEYDFLKITSFELQKLFINTQMVRYGKKKKFSYVDVMKARIKNDAAALIKADKMIMEQVLTKDKSWSTEEEWRVIMNDRDNFVGRKVPVDMISAIYIDFSVSETDKAKKIIEIAKNNGWQIYIRYFCRFEAEYRYDTIENTNIFLDKTKFITNRG